MAPANSLSPIKWSAPEVLSDRVYTSKSGKSPPLPYMYLLFFLVLFFLLLVYTHIFSPLYRRVVNGNSHLGNAEPRCCMSPSRLSLFSSILFSLYTFSLHPTSLLLLRVLILLKEPYAYMTNKEAKDWILSGNRLTLPPITPPRLVCLNSLHFVFYFISLFYFF